MKNFARVLSGRMALDMSNNRFALNVDFQLEGEIQARLLYVSSSKYERDWHSTRHTHYFTEIFYVIRGHGRFIFEGQSLEAGEDDVVIVNPYVEHTEISRDAAPLEYVVLGIGGLAFLSSIDGAGGAFSLCNYQSCRKELLFYLNTLIDEVTAKQANYQTACQDLLELFIIKMLRHTGCALSVASAQKSPKECSIVKRFIDTNFAQAITLDSLAEMIHMNKFYLVHAFTKHTGRSPISYLIAKRIEESRNLIATTDHSISQIADIVGFSSPSYYSQAFKRSVGLSPNEYRKQVKQKKI